MIGRKNESEKLQSAMDKDRAQLIAVYGRRRVGKTFLINEFFEGKFIFKPQPYPQWMTLPGKGKKTY